MISRKDSDPEFLHTLLNKGKYTSIAITDGNEPYILNLHYGFDPDIDTLYFLTDKGGLKLDFLKSNPYVCGTVVIEEDKIYSCIFRGVMEVIHNMEDKNKALSFLLKKKGIFPDPEKIKNPMYLKLELDELEGREIDP